MSRVPELRVTWEQGVRGLLFRVVIHSRWQLIPISLPPSPLQPIADMFPLLRRMQCSTVCLMFVLLVCDVVRALPTRGPMQRVVACTVTMCADVCGHKLDQWRSSSSSTDISIT